MLINSWLTLVKNSLQKSNSSRPAKASRKRSRNVVSTQPGAEMLEMRALLSATGFMEDFSSGTLPGNLERSGVGLTAAPVNGSYGGSVFENGYVRFTGQDTRGDASGGLRTFLRTVDDDYSSVDFVAEVTVTIVPNNGSPNLGRNIAFFGLGTGDTAAVGVEPDSAGIRLNVYPTNFNFGLITWDGGSNGGSVPAAAGGNGTYRLRMTWSACDEVATFQIDKNYTGGAFVADYTLGTIDGSDNGFNATNSRLYIGSDWNTRFDDFSVVVSEPACDSSTHSIGNASVTEGNSGTTVLSYPVTLSNPVDVAVSVDYTTQDGTATAGSDYVGVTNGTLTIPAGSTTGTINITVNGDTAIELDETLSVLLSNVQASGRNVTIGVNTVTPGIVQLDASTLGLASGTVVTSWGGQTAGGTPTLLAGQTPNGGAAVQFNAGGDRLGDNVFVPASAAGDFIYVAVVKANNIGAYHNLVDDDAQNRPILWIDGSFNYEMNFGGGGGTKAAGTGPGGWDIVIMDSRLNQLYVNSATPNATGGGAVAFSAGETFDFFHRDGNQTFQGLVAEARIYNDRAAFGGDFAALYTELQTKWFGSGLGSSVGVGTIVNDDFNTPPVANDDAATTDEGSVVIFNVLDNDTDAENNIVASLTAAISSPTTGVLTDNGSGSFTFNPNGAFEALAAGDSTQVSFDYRIEDAYGQTDTATVTITINGLNDVATISGDNVGAMNEDATGDNGVLTVSDVDQGENVFQPQTSVIGTYGTFSINAAGNWNYTRTSNLDVMNAGDVLNDSFTVVSADATASKVVTVTITGVNDVATISGDNAGTLTEEGSGDSGVLTVSDLDDAENVFQPLSSVAGTYGTFSINATGNWNYA